MLVPGKRGYKGYALLREALRRTERVGLATVVIHARQHVCAVVPADKHLLVITLRYASELKAIGAFPVAAATASARFSARELQMAERLVHDMEEPFNPSAYTDRYRSDLMKRIKAKIAAGETEVLTEPASEPSASGDNSNVVDLMSLLKRSLDKRDSKRPAGPSGEPASVTALKRAPANKKTAARTSRQKATRSSASPRRVRG